MSVKVSSIAAELRFLGLDSIARDFERGAQQLGTDELSDWSAEARLHFSERLTNIQVLIEQIVQRVLAPSVHD